MDTLLKIVQTINMYLSDYVLIILLLGAGLYFTIRTRFVQVRCFGEGWRRFFGEFSLNGEKHKAGMSSFQALATAVAAQVGTGNIVGACGAILIGGPGAIFWMWIIAFFGMATIYAEAVLGIERPRVAVLNIGEEETKGNAQTKATYELLKAESRINFVGNVEGSYLFSGKVADVIVCDGFVGNTALKMAEGLYRINTALGCRNAFWDAMNYENVGGTPVLGVNAPVIIGHGCSSPQAIRSMILSTEQVIKADLTAKLQRAFQN